MIHLPERARADLRFYAVLYAGMFLGSVAKALVNARKHGPKIDEEAPREGAQ